MVMVVTEDDARPWVTLIMIAVYHVIPLLQRMLKQEIQISLFWSMLAKWWLPSFSGSCIFCMPH